MRRVKVNSSNRDRSARGHKLDDENAPLLDLDDVVAVRGVEDAEVDDHEDTARANREASRQNEAMPRELALPGTDIVGGAAGLGKDDDRELVREPVDECHLPAVECRVAAHAGGEPVDIPEDEGEVGFDDHRAVACRSRRRSRSS